MPDKQDKIYEIAIGVATGACGHWFTYCIEQDKYYVYKIGVWEEVAWMELMSLVSENPTYAVELAKVTPARKKQLLEHIKMMLFKRLKYFNATGRLNFDLGEFDPLTLKMYDHHRENYSTLRIPYPFDHTAKCELWLKTLNEIFEGNEDKVEVLQEFFGYCLTTKNNQKKALLLVGEGDTGKSTILFSLRDMLGSFNCSSIPLSSLKNPVFMPQLMNKLVNIDADVGKDAQDYEPPFKLMTSNEPIFCNPKYAATFDFLMTAKMVLGANIFPRITDHSSAFYNRLIIIPCDHIFGDKEKDRDLSLKMSSELPGIFNWACIGLRRLVERGKFKEYDFTTEAVKELEDENNPSNVFFDEYIEIGSGSYIEKGELYEKYKTWCSRTNTYTLTLARFSNAVYRRFHKHTHKQARLPEGGKRVWQNIKYVESKDAPELMAVEREIEWEN